MPSAGRDVDPKALTRLGEAADAGGCCAVSSQADATSPSCEETTGNDGVGTESSVSSGSPGGLAVTYCIGETRRDVGH